METVTPPMMALVVAGLTLLVMGALTLYFGHVFAWLAEWVFDLIEERWPR